MAWVEWVAWVEWECNRSHSFKNSKRAVFTALFFIKKNIQQLKSILSLNNEKIKFGEVRLKELSLNLKTKNKLKFTKEDIKVIRKDAKFFFSEYNYSKQVPKIFLK